ncbi:MAG: ECF transporter S component [Clostridia bacterium]|nr:ECF transporter S component [Clostridia bacterium]
MNLKKGMSTKTIAIGAIMTAIVIVVQCLATYTTFFGPFSTAIALIPIVIGAAMCGPLVGAWLGFVFGIVVIATGGAALFFEFSIPGTIVTVIFKGTLCGLSAGFVYKLIKKHNLTVAAIASALIAPLVNTGIFLLGSAIFFLPKADMIAEKLSLGVSGMDVFVALAGANFLFELGMCIVLSPVIVRLLNIKKKA